MEFNGHSIQMKLMYNWHNTLKPKAYTYVFKKYFYEYVRYLYVFDLNLYTFIWTVFVLQLYQKD